MELPIYELKINDSLNDDSEVSYVALVDAPAIKKDFIAFKDEFIEPSKGEHQDEFLPRCISYVVGEGKDPDQAIAICNSLWDNHFADETCPVATQDIKTNLANRQNAINVAHYGPLNPNLPNEEYWIAKGKQFNATPEEAKQSVCGNCSFFNVSQMIKDCIAKGIGGELDPYQVIDAGELGYCEAFHFKCASQRTCDAWVVGGPIKMAEDSFTDYPQAATDNAKIALRWAEENGWGDCGTSVGKIRANQLAKKEPISRDTIARMSAFERHRQNSQNELGDGCGRLMWLAWGGDEGIAWASRKLQQIDKMAGGISFDFDGVLTTSKGIDLLDEKVSRRTNVYIISARSDDKSMKEFAQKHGVNLRNVYATGSNKAKIEKVKELGVSTHYDNNIDVVKELGSIGNKFQTTMGFAITNEDDHIISGPLMLADELIYRNNDRFGEHYVKFTAETIKSIAVKFAKKKFQNHVNLMHDSNQIVDGCTMFESFIVDKKRGILPMVGFEDVADGSWFGSFYVENPDVWNQIKSGELKGFSVEGLFDYEAPETPEEQALKKISKLLNEIIIN